MLRFEPKLSLIWQEMSDKRASHVLNIVVDLEFNVLFED